MTAQLLRYTAFSRDPAGGNPAGVWLGARLPDADRMQGIAAQVGDSETAFVAAPGADGRRPTRYFSPEAEVPFCGHATIAAAVALGDREGDGGYVFATAAGDVPVQVSTRAGARSASLVSVLPRHEPAAPALLRDVLDTIGWREEELDPAIPPARAYAGAWHLVLAAADATRLATLDYDVARLKALMLADGLTTLQLVWRESPARWHARNPFPVGGVFEDPATGAAAAALGGYLRDACLVTAPVRLDIHQGAAMGRPGLLLVDIPATGGITVSGDAVAIPFSPTEISP